MLDFAALSSKFVNRKVWMFFYTRLGTPVCVLLYGINMMIQKRYLVVVVAGKKRESAKLCTGNPHLNVASRGGVPVSESSAAFALHRRQTVFG